MGLNYTAIDQTPDVTRSRIAGGRCFVAVDAADRVIGTVLLLSVRPEQRVDMA